MRISLCRAQAAPCKLAEERDLDQNLWMHACALAAWSCPVMQTAMCNATPPQMGLNYDPPTPCILIAGCAEDAAGIGQGCV